MAFGAIVGLVDLYDCTNEDDEWFWHLRNVRRLLSPISWRGQRGLFDVPKSAFLGRLFTDQTMIAEAGQP
jgi:hypothetical protein